MGTVGKYRILGIESANGMVDSYMIKELRNYDGGIYRVSSGMTIKLAEQGELENCKVEVVGDELVLRGDGLKIKGLPVINKQNKILKEISTGDKKRVDEILSNCIITIQSINTNESYVRLKLHNKATTRSENLKMNTSGIISDTDRLLKVDSEWFRYAFITKTEENEEKPITLLRDMAAKIRSVCPKTYKFRYGELLFGGTLITIKPIGKLPML